LLQAAMAQQVRVGVILNLTSPVGQRRKVGIEMAMEDYYTANPSSRTRVVPRFRDSGGEVVGAASAGKLSPISEFRCIYIYIYPCILQPRSNSILLLLLAYMLHC